MRPTISGPVLHALSCALLFATAPAQEPEPGPATPARPAGEAKPNEDKAAAASAAAPAAPRERTIAIHAAHIHPIAGADVENGIVLIRGDRIVAVGADGAVAVPADAETITFLQGHVYPGLVDAASDAFTDDAVRAETLDAGAALADGLRRRGDREDAIVRGGITTVYIGGRGNGPWSGQGAIVRPTGDGFAPFPGHEHAAVGMRLAAAAAETHPLQRQQLIETVFRAFAELDDYKKKLDEHQKALEKYKKDFADYLAWHEKKNGKAGADKPADAASPPANAGNGGGAREGQDAAPGARGGQRGGRGRRGGGGGDGERPPQDRPQTPTNPAPAPQGPGDGKPADGKPADAKAAGDKTEAKPAEKPGDKAAEKPAEDKAPERPKYPKAPPREPSKDALLDVLDGKLPLRVEVVRPDEIRAVLAAARDRKVPSLVLENVLGGAAIAADLASASVPCVLTGVWPGARPEAFAAFDALQLPSALLAAGVPFAIASGSGRRAAALPLMAACAVGAGLDEAQALRAITLTPAEILGVQKDVGSLQAGKLADVLVCDRPLLRSDCRVLAVWSAGATAYQAEEPR